MSKKKKHRINDEVKTKEELKIFCYHAYEKCCDEQGDINFYSVGNNCSNYNIMDKLFKCIPFEHPDGYYFDAKESVLYIFEHFEFDCSPSSNYGSKLRRNESIVLKKENNEIKNKKVTEIASIVEQGYCENNTYKMGANGIEYRNNYIENFTNSFNKHLSQIEKYKDDCMKKLKLLPNKIVISFVCEDKTLGGTYYKENNKMGKCVNPLATKQFINLLKKSSIDYLIFNSQNDPSQLTVLSKNSINDNLLKKSEDLEDKEFYIIPAFPKFTFIKYYDKK